MKKFAIFILLFSLLICTAITVQAAVKPVRTQSDIYNMFKNSLGGRAGLLNANYKSGEQGAFDYTQKYISTTTINGTNVVDTTTGPREKMDWFKAKFIENTAGDLNQRDKEGIMQAMKARYADFCYADFKSKATSTPWKNYISATNALAKTRQAAISTCMTGLGVCAKAAEAGGGAAIERCKIQKDICVSAAYSAYQNSLLAEYDKIFGSYKTALDACKSEARITDWW